MEVGDQGIDQQAHTDVREHPKAILGRLRHISRKSGAIAQFDRWRIERLVRPIPGKRHPEDQENGLRRVEESIRMTWVEGLRVGRKAQEYGRQEHQGYSSKHIPSAQRRYASPNLCELA